MYVPVFSMYVPNGRRNFNLSLVSFFIEHLATSTNSVEKSCWSEKAASTAGGIRQWEEAAVRESISLGSMVPMPAADGWERGGIAICLGMVGLEICRHLVTSLRILQIAITARTAPLNLNKNKLTEFRVVSMKTF